MDESLLDALSEVEEDEIEAVLIDSNEIGFLVHVIAGKHWDSLPVAINELVLLASNTREKKAQEILNSRLMTAREGTY